MSSFADKYPKLASFLLYFYDPPVFRLTGNVEEDIATLDKIEREAVDQYVSRAANSRQAVLAEGRKLMASADPPWEEIDNYVGARPKDPRDPPGPQGARSWLQRVLGLLEETVR